MSRSIKATLNRWTFRGEAVVEPPGMRPLVVWQGIPGEDATVQVVRNGKNQLYAHWMKARAPHDDRVHPVCERYTPCGGCPWMHLREEAQQEGHRSLLRRALDKEGLEEVEIGALHKSPDGLHDFRHVVKVGFGRSQNGNLKLGAWGRHSRHIVPIPKCVVAAPILNKAMALLAHLSIELEIEPYDLESGKGVMRAAILRASRTTGKVLITLVAGRRSQELATLAERLEMGLPEVVGVWLHLNDDFGNNLFQRREDGGVGVKHLAGRSFLEEQIGGIRYRIGPGDFFQTNPSVAEPLYKRTVERLELQAEEAVLDLYCGVGGLALQAEPHVSYVLGVEENVGCIRAARETANRHRSKVTFLAEEVQEALKSQTSRFKGTPHVVIVNPARRGLEEGVVGGIAALEPRRVAYVSCNPKAFARDVKRFQTRGFTMDSAEIFEMFPNTPHMEILIVMTGPVSKEGTTRRSPRRKVVRS